MKKLLGLILACALTAPASAQYMTFSYYKVSTVQLNMFPLTTNECKWKVFLNWFEADGSVRVTYYDTVTNTGNLVYYPFKPGPCPKPNNYGTYNF